ncbi:MAG: histidine kinase, partial [Bacteroidota bacterium]
MPIILALVMPAIRYYNAGEEGFAIDAPIIAVWLYYSLVLYVLWYLLWQLWEIRQGHKKWYALALLGILSSLVFFYFLLFQADTPEGVIDISTIKVLPPLILFVTVQYALQSQRKVSHLSLEKEQLQTENYKTQLQVLQAKVDPHFLFNSLNTLRSMVRHGHDNSEKFILSLSDFYRQTLRYNEDTQLRLSEELTVLESYLFLMKS